MKICVCYSDSHKHFLDNWFLKSFPYEENVTLIIGKLPQVCSSGGLFSDGLRDQMVQKQIFINKCIQDSQDGEVILFSDVDVSFYGLIEKDLMEHAKDADICFMKDHNSDEVGRCGGFFCLTVSDKTRSFFSEVLETLKSHAGKKVSFETSEQSTINNLLRRRSDVTWKYLPPKYYTHGLYTQGIKNFSKENQSGLWWENKSYEEKSGVYVPNDMLVHHANWCHGIDTKKDALYFIKTLMDYRKSKPKRGG